MCKKNATKKQLVKLCWDVRESDDVTQPEGVGSDEETGIAAKVEVRILRKKMEAVMAVSESRKVQAEKYAALAGGFEHRLKAGAATKELEEMNTSLHTKLDETLETASEFRAKIADLEAAAQEEAKIKRDCVRRAAQAKSQNQHLNSQYELMKEQQKKNEEKLKTYKYLDVVLGGGEESNHENLSKEQLIKTLSWRTKCYKQLSEEKQKRIRDDEDKAARLAALQQNVAMLEKKNAKLLDVNNTLQDRMDKLQRDGCASKTAWKPLLEEAEPSPQTHRGHDEYETDQETDEYDSSPEIKLTQQPVVAQSQPGRTSQQVFQSQFEASSQERVVITKSTLAAGQAPSLRRVCEASKLQKAKSSVAYVNKGKFIRHERDASGSIITLLKPELKQRENTNIGRGGIRKVGVKRPASSGSISKKVPRIENYFGKRT